VTFDPSGAGEVKSEVRVESVRWLMVFERLVGFRSWAAQAHGNAKRAI
jgi:hypothetical protein